MKRIEKESEGAFVQVRGRRSLKQDQSDDPLVLYVSGTTRSSLDKAVSSVMALLTRVHADYVEFCILKGQPCPDLAVVCNGD